MTTIIYYIKQQTTPTAAVTATAAEKNILYACIRYKHHPPVLSYIL